LTLNLKTFFFGGLNPKPNFFDPKPKTFDFGHQTFVCLYVEYAQTFGYLSKGRVFFSCREGLTLVCFFFSCREILVALYSMLLYMASLVLGCLKERKSTRQNGCGPNIINNYKEETLKPTSINHQPTHLPTHDLPSPTTTHTIVSIYPFPFTLFARHILPQKKERKKERKGACKTYIGHNQSFKAIMLASMTNFCWLKSMTYLHHTTPLVALGAPRQAGGWVCVHSEDGLLTNKE
jgi:hypothetical protein